MELARAKNVKRNVIFGFINRFVALLLPFINRTVFIYFFSIEYLGLNSLFSSLLQILNMAELGVGSAIVYSMYKPIADDDDKTICALLNLYRKIYRVIGCVIFCVGLCLMPFLSQVIHGDCPPDVNLYVVYALYLLNTSLSYWCFAYKSAIPMAFQRVDIVNNASSLAQVFQTLAQVVVIILYKNYYIYLLVMPIATFVNNMMIYYLVNRHYPQYRCIGSVSKRQIHDIKVKVSGLIVGKVCQMTRNAFDSVFLTYFVGLAITGIYNNYYYVMSSVTSLFAIFSTAIVAGAGNSVALSTPEKNYDDMRKLNFIYMLLAGWAAIIMFVFYQPFMNLWVGESMMLPIEAVVLLVGYFYMLKMGDIRAVYVDATGLWWEQKYRAIVEAITNIILNATLGYFFGIYGIISATLISLFAINFCWGSTIIFQNYFPKNKIKEYFYDHVRYFVVSSVILLISYECTFLMNMTSVIADLFVKLLIVLVVPLTIYFIIYSHDAYGKSVLKWMINKLNFIW